MKMWKTLVEIHHMTCALFFFYLFRELDYAFAVLCKRSAWRFFKISPRVSQKNNIWLTVWCLFCRMTPLHFTFPVKLLSTMAVEGAEGSKAVEFEFGACMSHLRSVRETYDEGKHSSFSGDWNKNTHTFTQWGSSISAGSRTSPDSQCKRELPHSRSDQDLFLCAWN